MPHAASSAPDIADLAEALRPLLLRLSRRLRRESHRLGVSPFDASLLASVRQHPGVGVCELADREQITRPTMSVHVKRLEAAGWLARQAPDADDKRRIGLVVTEAGEAALEAVRRHRNDWLAARLEALSPEGRALLMDAIGPLARLSDDRLQDVPA
jgi:DNA-binding MarR family transcriptional regulator